MKQTNNITNFPTTQNPSSNSDLDPKYGCRKFNNASSRGGGGTRLLRRRSRTPVGKGSKPDTPFLKWKTENAAATRLYEYGDARGGRRELRNVSVRKLGAVLWRMQLSETDASGGGGVGFEQPQHPGDNHVGVPFLTHHHGDAYGSEANDLFQSPEDGTKDGIFCKLGPSLKFYNSMMGGATKWDPVFPKPLDGHQIHGYNKPNDKEVTSKIRISALEAELEQARLQIQELESEHHSSKRKMEQFLKKVSEERAAWRSREHEKIRTFIDDLKADLNCEKKDCQSLEIINCKLVNELTEAKLSAKRFMQEYATERKTRELVEAVCDELAKEIGEDKGELEALKREAANFQEDVEEERKILQMTEVWREERVQMKLVDAKLALEEKYSQMNTLVGLLETFLKSRSTPPNAEELQKAETLGQAAASLDIQDMKEFKYEPANLDDSFSVFEDVNFAQCSEKEIKPCNTVSPASHASKTCIVTPEVNIIKESFKRHSSAYCDWNDEIEDDDSGWETVSHLEDQGSCYLVEGSGQSINKNLRHSDVSASGTEWEGHGDRDSPITEISEIYSIPTKQLKKSSIGRLWRTCSNNGNNICKVISVEGSRPSNGRMSNVSIASVDHGSSRGCLSPPDMMGFCSSPDSARSYIVRGKNGCIEWPRGMQKNSLKAKLLEARMGGQKVQLRQVLDQKY